MGSRHNNGDMSQEAKRKRENHCIEDGRNFDKRFKYVMQANETLELIACLLKEKRFDHKNLSLSANWEKFKKTGDIPYCWVLAFLWAVFGCRLTTIPLVAFVIDDLYSQDLCGEYGTTFDYHRDRLLKCVKDKYKVRGKEIFCIHKVSRLWPVTESFHEWFTMARHGPKRLTSQESFLVAGAMPGASISHTFCLRYEEILDGHEWVVTDQYNPYGTDITSISHDWKIIWVHKITSPNRPEEKKVVIQVVD